MLNTLGIVEVRCEAGQVNSKIGRKLGGKSLLELVVRRVTDCLRLDAVVVLAAASQSHRIRQLVPPDVSVFTPTQRDPLARFAATLDEFETRSVVRVSAEHPFVDPVLIDRLVSTADSHPNCDYISYCCADGRPAILTQVGLLAEWCSADALRRADRQAKRPGDREHVTGFLYAPSGAVQRTADSLADRARSRRSAAEGRRRGRLGPCPGDLRGVGSGRMGLATDCRSSGWPARLAQADGGPESSQGARLANWSDVWIGKTGRTDRKDSGSPWAR